MVTNPHGPVRSARRPSGPHPPPLLAPPDISRVFGARLLADTPTHEGRDPGLLRRWAEAATAFGAELAQEGGTSGRDPAGSTRVRVVERGDGVDRLLLARYPSRPGPAVELYTDRSASPATTPAPAAAP